MEIRDIGYLYSFECITSVYTWRLALFVTGDERYRTLCDSHPIDVLGDLALDYPLHWYVTFFFVEGLDEPPPHAAPTSAVGEPRELVFRRPSGAILH